MYIYDKCVRDLVVGCFDGYNAAVLTYDEKESGENFTMRGTRTYDVPDEEFGIISRAIEQFFDEIEKRRSKAKFLLKASFAEISNNDIRDLLDNKGMKGRIEYKI